MLWSSGLGRTYIMYINIIKYRTQYSEFDETEKNIANIMNTEHKTKIKQQNKQQTSQNKQISKL